MQHDRDGFYSRLVIRITILDIDKPMIDLNFEPQLEFGPIFLENLDCQGGENSLLDCTRRSFLSYDQCSHAEDVGVTCTGKYGIISK